jgi:hypothetical protein
MFHASFHLPPSRRRRTLVAHALAPAAVDGPCTGAFRLSKLGYQLTPHQSHHDPFFTAVCKANGTHDHFINKSKLITSRLAEISASSILDRFPRE